MSRALSYNVWTEGVAGSGYADILLQGTEPYMDNNMVIEIKYIKKDDYNEEKLNEKRIEAIDQINKYSKDRRINSNLTKYIVVFTGRECKLLEEVNNGLS